MGNKELTPYQRKLLDPRWQKKRLKILERDDFQCQLCGDKETTLHVHHINYGPNPWDIPNELLITLCEECHEKETSDFNQSIYDITKALKNNGFMSLSVYGLIKIINSKNRGWTFYEPLFDIMKMVIDDDDLWKEMEELFWDKLNKKCSKDKNNG